MGVDEVAECAVVGIKDDLKGHVPLGFCIMKTGEYEYKLLLLTNARSLLGLFIEICSLISIASVYL